MSKPSNYSRRLFLKNAALMTTASTVGLPFALDLFRMNLASAATTGLTDYKALVCIYLGGGNDHNNMVIATDTTSWAGYLAARNTGGGASIALMNPDTTTRAISITPANNQGRTFGLHPAMTPMQTLFNNGRAGIVANVGPLLGPIANKTVYNSTPSLRPANLFSHSDQTAQWISSQATPQYGWGGRVAEQVINNNTKPNFTCISSSGNTLFLAGNNVNQYQINSSGSATAIQGITNTSLFGVTVSGGNPLKDVITPAGATNLLEIDHAAVVQRSIDARTDLNDVMTATASVVTAAPTTGAGAYVNPLTGLTGETNPLATQLRTVARIIAGHNKLGANRQIFFVTLGGFDTHDFQANGHAVLMARLAHGLSYFDTTLQTLPVFDTNLASSTVTDVSTMATSFTASDFGRTFTSNGDGTDHGWGAHHFVVGGAVKARQATTGDIYGTFPDTVLGHNLDVGSGNLIPQISVDQYAATMAKWFGLSGDANSGDIQTVFPNLYRFSPTLLGFL